MSHHNPPIRNAVIAALKALKKATCAEIADDMDWPAWRVADVIRNGRRLHPGEMFHVVGYRPPAPGSHGKDSAIYAFGPGKDVQRANKNHEARRKRSQDRYRQKNRQVINARHRIHRAKAKGHSAAPNVWSQLAPREVRPYMTVVQRATDNQTRTSP